MNTWLGSAFKDACVACVRDMHSCDNSVVQHCADPIKHNKHCAAERWAAQAGGRSGPDSGLARQQLDGGGADADGAGGAAAPGVRQVGLPNVQSKQ